MMARLLPGENAKIDNINNLVEVAQGNDVGLSREALGGLLSIFHPLILRLCSKWSKYFNDDDHKLISWDSIIADAQYWFIEYTTGKYIIDGDATYNKFIKDHLDQRIRYIYECELKYRRNNIFPDPSRGSELDGGGNDDPFEDVVYRYRTDPDRDISTIERMMDIELDQSKRDLVTIILSRMGNTRYFSQREAIIFKECIMMGRTHEDIGKQLGISRTRVSQIMGRVREKIRDMMMDEEKWWEVY